MSEFGRAGNILLGVGEGLQGRGSSFIRNLEESKRREREEAERGQATASARDLERLKTQYTDSRAALRFAEEGRFDLAAQIGQERLKQSSRFPKADFSDTQMLTDQAIAASRGDAGAAQQLLAKLRDNVAIGRELGVFGDEAAPSEFTLSPGQQRFRGGEMIAEGAPVPVKDTSRTAGDVQKQVNTLRGSLKDVTKTFRQVEEANQRIKKAAKRATPASDISLIFNFMKMNDPGSTVREGEFATAQNAAGVPARVVNLYNQTVEGTRLNTDQRADFLSQSNELFEAQREATDNQIENILQQADEDDITRRRVFGTPRLDAFNGRVSARKRKADKLANKFSGFSIEPAGGQ